MSNIVIDPYRFAAAPTPPVATNSLSLPGAITDYLTHTFSGAATSSQIATLAWWQKTTDLVNQKCYMSTGSASVASDSDFVQLLNATTDDPLQSALSNAGKRRTTSGINDTDWHHICIGIDTTQATEIDRMTVEIDLVDVTSHLNDITQNETFNWMLQNRIHVLGHRYLAGARAQEFPGNIAELHMIDGQKLGASSFVVDDAGTIKAIEYTGTFGNNGILQKYQNASVLGEDSSPNGHDWSTVGTGLSQSSDAPPSL